MKEIPLTNGMTTLVDDEDYESLSGFRWHAHSNGRKLYVIMYKNKRMYLMHREIMCAPDGLEVDHIDGNTLDNRRTNLRLCTKSQNRMNTPVRDASVSGYKGVWPGRSRWRAAIYLSGKQKNLGTFDTPEEAARAYDKAATHYQGEFAWLNFPIKNSPGL